MRIYKHIDMAAHNELGKWGEEMAIQLLESKGYGILHHDWKCGRRDLDIIAVTPERDTLVIVEVKARRNSLFTEPEEAVTPQKMRSIAAAANAFVKGFHVNIPVRFDIIAVTGTNEDNVEVNHIEDAFIPYF